MNSSYVNYVKNKNRYLELNFNLSGGGTNTDNVFLNKDHYSTHFNKKYRKKRIESFIDMYEKLKEYMFPGEGARIDPKLLKKYIDMYKKENRQLITNVINYLHYVSFEDFYRELLIQADNFNKFLKENKIKKYVFVFGVGSDMGESTTDYNIFKSNLWTFMLIWDHLDIKPYDIVLNLKIAIRLYTDTDKDENSEKNKGKKDRSIKDFLIVDDCSYSGNQIVDGVLKPASSELLFYTDDGYKIPDSTKTVFKPIREKFCNVHLLIPYMSGIAVSKINVLNEHSGLNTIKYCSFIVKPYSALFSPEDIDKLNTMYSKYYPSLVFSNLIPVFFEHKIADMVSTIDLILIKGQVLDDPEKRLVFIRACQYDEKDPTKYEYNPDQPNFLQRKLYCPIPPYLNFSNVLYRSSFKN